MLQQISVEELHKSYADDLVLHWVAGKKGGLRLIDLQSNYKLANIGYLNPIHPHQIQIVGIYEFAYLDALSLAERKNTLDRLFKSQNLSCMIVVDMDEVLQHLVDYANLFNIAVFTSPMAGEHIINYLHTSFARMVAPRETLHGVFMDVLGMGVLIMGESGTGKSELALELVSRGHRLVADDAPEFSRIAPQILNGAAPFPETNEFLEVRGLGILNVQALYGDSATKKEKFLRLIVHLKHMTPERMKDIDRLQGDYRVRNILDVNIPEIFLPVAPGRNLAVLLETAVRNHSLKIGGYNAADDFCAKQSNLMQIISADM